MSLSVINKYSYIRHSLRNRSSKITHQDKSNNSIQTYIQKLPNICEFKTIKNKKILTLNKKKRSFDNRNYFKDNKINLNSFFSSKTNRGTDTSICKKINVNAMKRSSSTPNIVRTFEFNKKKINNNLNDTICLLSTDFQVKNFSMDPIKVIDYLKLNNNKKIFFSPIHNKNDLDNTNQKIEKSNVNIKNLFCVDIKNETKKKNDVIYKILRENNALKKIMRRLKDKAVNECNKLYPTDMAYNSKLLLETMKIYKSTIHHLQDKNSLNYKNNIPLYNRFLNID